MKRKTTLDDEMGSSLFTGAEKIIKAGIISLGLLSLSGVLVLSDCSKSNEKTSKIISNIENNYLSNTQQIPGIEYTLGGLIEVYQSKLQREVNAEEIIAKNMKFYNEKTGTFSRYCCDLK
jgi:hypothetical protein